MMKVIKVLAFIQKIEINKQKLMKEQQFQVEKVKQKSIRGLVPSVGSSQLMILSVKSEREREIRRRQCDKSQSCQWTWDQPTWRCEHHGNLIAGWRPSVLGELIAFSQIIHKIFAFYSSPPTPYPQTNCPTHYKITVKKPW